MGTSVSDAPAGVSIESEPSTDQAPPLSGVLGGNPGTVGIPAVIAGATGLGLINTGWVHVSPGAGLPIYMGATVLGLLFATLWACALGQNASASVYGVFLGFYGSYAGLVLGLTHNWYGIPADQTTKTIELWLISWLVTIGILTLVTLRLPSVFTLLLVLVDVALVVLLIGTAGANPTFIHIGGYVVFAFVAVAVYLYVDAMWRETGGQGLPLGKPLVGA